METAFYCWLIISAIALIFKHYYKFKKNQYYKIVQDVYCLNFPDMDYYKYSFKSYPDHVSERIHYFMIAVPLLNLVFILLSLQWLTDMRTVFKSTQAVFKERVSETRKLILK